MPPSTKITLKLATQSDAAPLAALHTAVADHLTQSHGPGPWSAHTSEKSVLFAMRNSKVFLAKDGHEIIATLRLQTKKPWAIDKTYFTKCKSPLYLLAMAVTPTRQRQGLGSACLKQAAKIAKAAGADSLRLDAYNAKAGAGPFYAHCGFTEMGRVTYRNAPLIYYELLLIPSPPGEGQGEGRSL